VVFLPREPIHVVSTEGVPGYDITSVKGLVWGTSVRSKFVGKDMLAILRVLVGGEIKEYTGMVNEARRYVVERMVDNARALGANAVVSTRIGSPSQIVPGTVEIFAYGTAVIIEPKPKRTKKTKHRK
jgi:uncharacterized protein YbjQ (UPF0145 family)